MHGNTKVLNVTVVPPTTPIMKSNFGQLAPIKITKKSDKIIKQS